MSEWREAGKGGIDAVGPIQVRVDADPGGYWRVWMIAGDGEPRRIHEGQNEAVAKDVGVELLSNLHDLVRWARANP